MAFGNSSSNLVKFSASSALKKPMLDDDDDDPFDGLEYETNTCNDLNSQKETRIHRSSARNEDKDEDKPCIPPILPILSKEELKKRVSHLKGITFAEMLNPPLGSNLEKLPKEYLSKWINYQAPEDKSRLRAKENFSKKLGEIECPVKKEEAAQQLLGFGKFADKTYQYVYERHRYYYDWACREVRGFKEKAEKFINKSG